MTALSRLRTAGLAALMICGVALAPAQAQLPSAADFVRYATPALPGVVHVKV
jgi:hypothetical protein